MFLLFRRQFCEKILVHFSGGTNNGVKTFYLEPAKKEFHLFPNLIQNPNT